MTELHYLSATEALARFRSRDLSPVELLEAVIARAEEVEPTVNALCHTFYDEAPRAGAGRPRRGTWARASSRGRSRASRIGDQGGGGGRRPAVDAGLADLQGPGRRASRRRSRSGSSTPGAIVHARTTAPEFSCAASPTRGCTASPATRGTRSSPSAARPAARAPRWRRARRRWPAARTSAARSASRPRSTASSASSRRTAACRRPRRSTSTSTATAARWRAPSPTARCSRTCSPGRTRATTCRCARSSSCPSSFERRRGPAGRASRVDLGGWPVDPEVRRQHAGRRPRRCARPARSSRRSTCDVPRAIVDRARRRSTST